jgi:hypothetical protein
VFAPLALPAREKPGKTISFNVTPGGAAGSVESALNFCWSVIGGPIIAAESGAGTSKAIHTTATISNAPWLPGAVIILKIFSLKTNRSRNSYRPRFF